MVTKSQEFLRNFQILEKFWGILRGKIPGNFFRISRNWVSKLWSHKNPYSKGPILGNFSRISEDSVTGKESWEILPKKSPRLENLRKLLTFVTWELIKSVHLTYGSCAYDLQKVYIEPKKVYIEPKKVYIRPKTIKVYISDLKKDKKGLPSKSTFSMQHMLELYQACIGRIKENKCATDQQLL